MEERAAGSTLMLVDAVEQSLPATVERAVKRIWEELPAYGVRGKPDLLSDVRSLITSVFTIALVSIRENRPARRRDFNVMAENASRRYSQGVTLGDFLQGFRIGQATLWDQIIAVSRTLHVAEASVLPLASRLMQVIELGSLIAAEAYQLEFQTAIADEDRQARDLLETLLAGREVAGTSYQELAETTVPGRKGKYALIVADSVDRLRDGRSVRRVSELFRGLVSEGGLVVFRSGEFVAIIPTFERLEEHFVAGVRRVHIRLAESGVNLRIGVSKISASLSEVPAAYRDACIARRKLGSASGVVWRGDLRIVDYFLVTAGPSTRAQISPTIRDIVIEYLEKNPGFLETFLTYVKNDLNVKHTADQLHMHVNTAHYRLARLSERTGLNLRNVLDVMELYIAANLLTCTYPSGS